MPSVRFGAPSLEEPAYLEEVLVEGGLRDWKMIYEEISDRPFGPVVLGFEADQNARRLSVTGDDQFLPLRPFQVTVLSLVMIARTSTRPPVAS
jgi:hypothetical protein